MFVDRLVEMRRGIGRGLENIRTGVDQFLLDERGSDRFLGQSMAVAGSGIAVVMGGPAGEKIGRGIAEIVVQGSSEWAVRAGGNIGSGVGIAAALVCSGVVLYRVFRR